MSRRVQLVLLCEDKQHEAFARRFLNAMGWETRALRVEKAPGGRGSGEQFIRERFPLELKAHRSRPVSQALVVLVDGDPEGSVARLQRLDRARSTALIQLSACPGASFFHSARDEAARRRTKRLAPIRQVNVGDPE